MTTITIENEDLSVATTPAYGARVTSLRDRRSGREWMTQGPPSANTGEDVHYGGDEAVGWDECFPTVGRWDASATAWRRHLRDHGDLWGRPFAVEAVSADAVTLSRTTEEFRFSRTLRLEGATLVAAYTVENRTAQPLPVLWALHALLVVAPGDRIELPGVCRVQAGYMTHGQAALPARDVDWPEVPDLPFRLDTEQPPEVSFAAKLRIGDAVGPMRVGRDGAGWLELSWAPPIRDVGLWLTYGGWPGPGGHEEIAIEPQNAPGDDLGQAIAAGAPPLPAGGSKGWQVTLRVLP